MNVENSQIESIEAEKEVKGVFVINFFRANNWNCGGRGVWECSEGTFLNKEERKRSGKIPSENNDHKITPNYPIS